MKEIVKSKSYHYVFFFVNYVDIFLCGYMYCLSCVLPLTDCLIEVELCTSPWSFATSLHTF